tara:strand:+ start:342 stop:587 length:246 start_codon:yes stop_codon:yes gene_type:complete
MIHKKTEKLVRDAQQLKTQSILQKCPDCYLMRAYFNHTYTRLVQQTSQVERLLRTNFKNDACSEIEGIKQTLAVTGLYLNV